PNLTALSYDPSDGQVYAMGQNLTMINATDFTVSAPPITLPEHVLSGGSLAYDPSRQFLYATTPGSVGQVGQVTVINGATRASSYGPSGTIYAGFSPTSLLPVLLPGASTTASGIVIVANALSGSLGVIATSPARIDYFGNSPSAIDLGQSTQMVVQFTGGAGVSTVSYTGLPSGCASQNTLRLDCTPTGTGTYTITVRVTDELGGSTTASVTLSVARGLAVSAAFSSPLFPQVDPNSSFVATANVSGGTPPYNYSWNFGDGYSAFGPSQGISYSQHGLYLITLTATDNLGAVGVTAWSVLVNPSPSLTLTPSANEADVNHSITLSAAVAGGTGSGATTWDFGDGTAGTGSQTTHSWTHTGTFTVQATYHDGIGMAADSSAVITVNPALTGTFSSSSPPGVVPVASTLLDFNATPAGGSPPYAVLWNFGDDSQSLGSHLEHAYASAGNYTVNVTVTDGVGASLNATLHVQISKPTVTGTSSSGSSLNFPLGIFLGVLAGAALATVAFYAFGPRRRQEHPPRTPPSSPYVSPEPAEWKED
ncbi:MAG: PKD domain-containing protein, partial [Thermoplasmata archaeon]|nr:PKD domain-containing protein [Thermoplasmata archaeon]